MKKLSKILLALTLFSFLCSCLTFSQNLVPNPSFEDTVACPSGFNQLYKSEGWYRWGGGTPDYLNVCSSSFQSSIPNNALGHQSPFESSCKAYAGFLIYTIATNEFMAIQLISPLTIGQKYFVSFKVSLADTCIFASNNIGALFRVTSFQNITIPFPYTNFAHINSSDIISDKLNWTTISGSFIADSIYNYIVIGKFFEDSLTDTLILSGLSTDAYYYIDDVCVSTDSITCNPFNFNCGTEIIENNSAINIIQVYPNPVNKNLNIEIALPEKELEKLIIYNSQGIIIDAYYNLKVKYINVQKYGKGIYFITIYSNNQTFTRKFIIN